MGTSEAYFRTKLYPLQDGILDIVKRSGTPFYLTGGTALSRGRYGHRFSEDLDLFVDNDPYYASYVDALFALMKTAERAGRFVLDTGRLRRSEWHTQLWVSRMDGEVVDLKIDLVNDTGPHAGAPEINPELGRTDNWQNILANKVAALFRYEPKDASDIWIISRREIFDWREVISSASAKEGGVDPVALHDILRGVPEEELARVTWAVPVDLTAIRADLRTAAEDILFGRVNSLSTRTAG
jgi:predicted nucleotidyltransferase component of viral defense system